MEKHEEPKPDIIKVGTIKDLEKRKGKKSQQNKTKQNKTKKLQVMI